MTLTDEDRLEHMLRYARLTVDLLGVISVDELECDVRTLMAVLHTLQIVGEAANNISKELRTTLPELPLRFAANMRHVLVHGYIEVETKMVHDTVVKDLPPLIAQLEQLLGEEPAP